MHCEERPGDHRDKAAAEPAHEHGTLDEARRYGWIQARQLDERLLGVVPIGGRSGPASHDELGDRFGRCADQDRA
eukprot:6936414-Pyramimonas_sp.AAC.1